MGENQKLVVRDEATGRLLPGSKLAAGHKNPQVAMMHRLRQAFLDAVGTDRLASVIDHHIGLILQAKPKEAAPLLELLYAYCLGKPHQHVSMDVTADTTVTESQPAVPLDSADVAALELIRRKLTQASDDAEVIDVTPTPGQP